MPLWLSIPIVAALWLSSWITGLDFASGDRMQAYLTWGVTVLASVLLLISLARRA